MALPDKDLMAAIAATRFGLGARPGEIEAAKSNPQGFLKAQIRKEGAEKKFVDVVEQITYSGPLAAKNRQRALYVTERAVFTRNAAGRLELIEIAPGIDVDRDIVAQMQFKPAISTSLKEMDARIFRPEPMRLADIIAANPRPIRSERLARLATEAH